VNLSKKYFSKSVLLVAMLLSAASFVLSTAYTSSSAIANDQRYVTSHLLKEGGSIFDIFRRNPGDGTRGPNDTCVVSPRGDIPYIWSRTPLFVWFGGEGLRMIIRSRDVNDVKWEYQVPSGSSDMDLHEITYAGSPLSLGERYYFEMYSTGSTPVVSIPFTLIPEPERQEVQAGLNNISGTGDEAILQRVEYLASITYSPSTGIQHSTGKGLFSDLLKELLNSSNKAAYVEAAFEEYCSD
jgi:hypothetical protein